MMKSLRAVLGCLLPPSGRPSVTGIVVTHLVVPCCISSIACMIVRMRAEEQRLELGRSCRLMPAKRVSPSAANLSLSAA